MKLTKHTYDFRYICEEHYTDIIKEIEQELLKIDIKCAICGNVEYRHFNPNNYKTRQLCSCRGECICDNTWFCDDCIKNEILNIDDKSSIF